MLKYILAVLLALAIQCFITYMLMLKGFTKLNPIKFLKKFATVMSFAFSTSSSNATIPLNIETLDNKIGVSENISSFTIPLGATINMDGTIGKIGGVKYKLAGAVNKHADIFIAPSENYEEALELKKKNKYDIKIVKADTFEEALEELKKLK